MSKRESISAYDPGFPVPDYRFDQRNEMFKRVLWDETVRHLGERFYHEIRYGRKVGHGKIDYILRAASWNTEWAHAQGLSRSNHGLYRWEGVCSKMERFLKVDGRVVEDPVSMSRRIKRAALFFGADLVGICRLHPNWVYSHEFNTNTMEHYPHEVPDDCGSAIVMAVAMDYEAMRDGAMVIEGAATGLGYSRMAFLADLMAALVRGLGYKAIPCGNDTALSIPLAMAAGLGEAGRLGLLITPKFGPRVRLCKVFTNLPLAHDHYRPFGVTRFCKLCRVCAKKCPSQAISPGEMTTEGYNLSSMSGIKKWYVNGERCFGFWAKSFADCTKCIRVCPFNKPVGAIHDLSRILIRRTAMFNKLLLWIDGVMGYQKPYPPGRFWEGN